MIEITLRMVWGSTKFQAEESVEVEVEAEESVEGGNCGHTILQVATGGFSI